MAFAWLGAASAPRVRSVIRSQILNAGQLETAADFTGKAEGDVAEFLHPALYAQILNAAFELSDALKLDEETLLALSNFKWVMQSEAARLSR